MEHETGKRNADIAAPPAFTGEAAGELGRIRDAFDLFDAHSRQLEAAFKGLQNELAWANKELNAKNSELSRKVDELEKLSSRLHCILESLTDGVVVVNRDMNIEHCNAAAAGFFLMDRGDLIGRHYPGVDDDAAVNSAISGAIENGLTVKDIQMSFPDGNGGERHILAGVSPIRAPGGAILGAVEVLRDMTEFRVLENRLRHQDRMAALGEMAAGVAHEIRNPLGTIEGFARLLLRDLSDQPQHRRLADKIVQGAQNLNYVISNLLTYVRPMRLDREIFEVNKLLSSVGEVLEGNAVTRGVKLELAMAPGGAKINGDIRQLRQVLLNLGINAIDACKQGGKVVVGAAVEGGKIRLLVQDNGCGITPEQMPRIFDPFFTCKQGGTGLGLSLCHKIVVAHEGVISVDSVVDKGTVFKVEFAAAGG